MRTRVTVVAPARILARFWRRLWEEEGLGFRERGEEEEEEEEQDTRHWAS